MYHSARRYVASARTTFLCTRSTISTGTTGIFRPNITSHQCARFTKSASLSATELEGPASIEAAPKIQSIPPLLHVPANPPPLVVQKDVERYLLPLYARQWGVRYDAKHQVLRSDGEGFQFQKRPHLTKNFQFKDLDAAWEYLNGLGVIALKENHRSVMLTIRDHEVFFHTHTPRAVYRPLRGDTRDQFPTPGITHSDIRLAILAEKSFTDEFLAVNRGISPTRRRSRRAHPDSTDIIEKAYLDWVPKKVLEAKTLEKTEPAPIPAIRAETGAPVPVDEEALQKHFLPLYTRDWSVGYTTLLPQEHNRTDPIIAEVLNRTPVVPSHSARLTKRFSFHDFATTLAFIKAIGNIVRGEKVNFALIARDCEVRISSCTQLAGWTHDITLRDVAVATRIENLFTEKFFTTPSTPRYIQRYKQPQTVAELQESLQKYISLRRQTAKNQPL